MSPSALNPRPPVNRLLAALPPVEYRRLLPDLEAVPLAARAVLAVPRQAIPYVYFPTSSVISLLTLLQRGTSIEVGLVGCEGMAGLSLFLGNDVSPFRGLVQVQGEALRMRAEAFKARASREGPLRTLLLRYTSAFLHQLSQSVACIAHHSVEQRCCRWLLMIHDRVNTDRFPLTHEFLAAMLGVRRATITEVAQALQQKKVLRYTRGRVTVLNRQGLEAACCECYGLVKAEFVRLLG